MPFQRIAVNETCARNVNKTRGGVAAARCVRGIPRCGRSKDPGGSARVRAQRGGLRAQRVPADPEAGRHLLPVGAALGQHDVRGRGGLRGEVRLNKVSLQPKLEVEPEPAERRLRLLHPLDVAGELGWDALRRAAAAAAERSATAQRTGARDAAALSRLQRARAPRDARRPPAPDSQPSAASTSTHWMDRIRSLYTDRIRSLYTDRIRSLYTDRLNPTPEAGQDLEAGGVAGEREQREPLLCGRRARDRRPARSGHLHRGGAS
jgi:hypothetical protein